jgi:hypothetical protein
MMKHGVSLFKKRSTAAGCSSQQLMAEYCNVFCIVGVAISIWLWCTATYTTLLLSTSYRRCFSMTVPSSPWDIKYNTYVTCKCRSSTSSKDTSPRICHNCSCGKKSCIRSSDTARQLSLYEPRVPKYVLMIECSVLCSSLELAEPLHCPFICMSNRFKYKYIFVVISHLTSQSNKTRQAM